MHTIEKVNHMIWKLWRTNDLSTGERSSSYVSDDTEMEKWGTGKIWTGRKMLKPGIKYVCQ